MMVYTSCHYVKQAWKSMILIAIEQFLTLLEDSMELDAFASLRQAAREVEEQVLSRLMSLNMRQ
jgi:hypothetical protein